MWRDIQLAARQLAKDRLFTLSVIALLAAGIGANTALFGLVDALLLRPLPVRDPERLVRLVIIRPPLAATSEFSHEEYDAWRKHATGLTDLLAWSEQDRFVRAGDATERLRIHLVSGNFFEALGTQPAIGRLLPSTGDGQNVVLSYSYWQRRFHGDPGILGRAIAIEGHPFTIVGVTPKGFNGLTVETGPELRAPISAAKLWPALLNEGGIDCSVVGRLKPGVSLETAQAEAEAIRTAIREERTGAAIDGPAGTFQLEPAARGVSRMRSQFSSVLWMLMGGMLLLLLMVCANVAGLVMARIVSRQSELAVRVALGATRASLLRLLLAENLLLMLSGTAGAFAISAMLVPQTTAALPPLRDLTATRLPLTLNVTFDWRVFAFSMAASAVAVLLFGLAPALVSLRRDIHPLLKESRAGGGWRGRQLLIVAQVALATMLLAGAGLTLLTIQRLNGMDTGFLRDGVVTFSMDARMAGYDRPRERELRRRLLAEARQLPGTLSAGIASRGLMRGTGLKTTIARTGQSAPPSEFLNGSMNAVSPEYFATLGIPLIAGTLFTETDETDRRQPARRVVNQAFVRKFFLDRDPIGQTFGSAIPGNGVAKPQFQVIGVVGDTRYRGLREPLQPIVYSPFGGGGGGGILHIRTSAPSAPVISAMRAALTRIDPQLSFLEVTTLSSEIDASLWAERSAAFLATALALAATLIATAGIYALLAFAVQQRRREIGIRVALGAQRPNIVWLFGGRALILSAAGATIGVTLAWLIGPRIQALLFEVEPSDTRALAAAVACVVLSAVIGALVPSLRAARTQPSQVLREQ